MRGGLLQLIAYGAQDVLLTGGKSTYDVKHFNVKYSKSENDKSKIVKDIYEFDLNIYGCDICLNEEVQTVITYCGCTTKYCTTCIYKMNDKCCVCKRHLDQ